MLFSFPSEVYIVNRLKIIVMDGRFDKPNSFGLCQGGENLPEREDCELCQGGKLNEKESIELIARMISDTNAQLLYS